VPITNKRIDYALHKKEPERSFPPRTEVPQKVFEPVKIKKLSYPAKSYIVLYSVVGTLILFFTVLMITGILSTDNPDSLLSLFGFILISGAVSYLVYSKLFTPDKRIEKVIEKTDKREKIKGAEYVNKAFHIPVPGGSTACREAAAYKELPPPTKRQPFYHSRHDIMLDMPTYQRRQINCGSIDTQPQDRTVILNGENSAFPYLKRMLGNSTETIVIKSFPFMMGRLEGQVDYYINNPAVGKLHAEINKTDDGYFISDMNSRNGTIINGKRIEPIKEASIKHGDRITLGNEEFIFCSNNNSSLN
ncbi:MAG: FHA domain-containing protein, partial [Acetivibrionales bacterium]